MAYGGRVDDKGGDLRETYMEVKPEIYIGEEILHHEMADLKKPGKLLSNSVKWQPLLLPN